MTFSEAIKTVEELLEKVPVAGTENWNRMTGAMQILQAVRKQIEKQEKEVKEDGSGETAIQQRGPADNAGAI